MYYVDKKFSELMEDIRADISDSPLVGTHADKLFNNVRRMEELYNEIVRAIEAADISNYEDDDTYEVQDGSNG